MKKSIAVINPNAWDLQEIEKRKDQFNFIFIEDSFQSSSPGVFRIIGFFLFFNITRFIQKCTRTLRDQRIDGVLGTDEYLSCAMAAIIAKSLNLPHTPPEAILRSQHKYASRLVQKQVAPQHVPRFCDAHSNKEFPVFIKPIRGSASFLAKRIHSQEELNSFLKIGVVKSILFHLLMRPFRALFRSYITTKLPRDYFLTEAIIEGKQVTLEAFCDNGKFQLIGIVDSIMYPGSKISFERFEYPSRLPVAVQSEMESIANSLAKAFHFNHGIFNIEFFYNELTGQISIIEFNPRMAFQFTDLYEKVDGFNTFDLQLKLVLGEPVVISRNHSGVSASFVLRQFKDARVTRVPSDGEIQSVLRSEPTCRIRILIKEGQLLSRDFLQDTESFRYAIINLGAPTWDELYRNFERIKSQLHFEFLEVQS